MVLTGTEEDELAIGDGAGPATLSTAVGVGTGVVPGSIEELLPVLGVVQGEVQDEYGKPPVTPVKGPGGAYADVCRAEVPPSAGSYAKDNCVHAQTRPGWRGGPGLSQQKWEFRWEPTNKPKTSLHRAEKGKFDHSGAGLMMDGQSQTGCRDWDGVGAWRSDFGIDRAGNDPLTCRKMATNHAGPPAKGPLRWLLSAAAAYIMTHTYPREIYTYKQCREIPTISYATEGKYID
ncbi:hypothetical protein B0H13DRAFT_1882876 [Mycena leptocephala]|nr:hypothetical protein B0H13DRAFT_1882876 [Mycena leptocephala]